MDLNFMDLEAQIQLLIDNAPQDGVTPQLITAIASVLRAIAQTLRHQQYYILQNLENQWIMTTLSNRTNSQMEKHVVYAFPSLQDATSNTDVGSDPQVIAAPVPVTHLLFQLVALEPVDSIVFFETSGTTANAVEIPRHQLQSQIQKILQPNTTQTNQIKANPRSKYRNPNQIPPDIA